MTLNQFCVCCAVVFFLSMASMFFRMPSDYKPICMENYKQDGKIATLRADVDLLYNLMNVSLNEN